jgi:hypothetical protein
MSWSDCFAETHGKREALLERSSNCGICFGMRTLAGWKLRKRLRSHPQRVAVNIAKLPELLRT